MEKIKNLLSKNNYILSKILGAVLSVVVVIVAIVVIVSGNESEPKEGETTREVFSSPEATTKISEIDSQESSEIESTSTDETSIIESSDESTTLLESESTTKEEEITSKVPTGNNEKTTSAKPVTPTTTQAPPTTTQAPTMTQAPTTTTQQETTTEEETTTAPPRGANGVILEELTFYWLNQDPYTIPATWDQLVYERTGGAYEMTAYGIMCTDVPKRVQQNVLGNEILLYSQTENTGSTKEDVISLYGEPLYIGRDPSTGSIGIYYRYLREDEDKNQDIYILFEFSAIKTNYKLASIIISNLDNMANDPYTEQQ